MSQERESRPLLTISLMVMATLLCLPAFGKVIYVDDDAIAPGDGASWQTAYKRLHYALVAAPLVGEPVEIWVAQGRYTRDLESLLPFELSGDTVLRGGFVGVTGPDPNDRDITRYESVLSGDREDNDIDVVNPEALWREPTRSDNSERIVVVRGPGSVLLEGFTITGGYIGHKGRVFARPPDFAGGGVYVIGNNATIKDCVIKGNCTDQHGGGIAIRDVDVVRMISCTLASNVASDGGGVWSGGGRVELIHCRFVANWALRGGGIAVDCGSGSVDCSADLIGCIFEGNRARDDAGVASVWGGTLVASHCVSCGNYVLGPAVDGIHVWESGRLVLTNSVLSGNTNGKHAAGYSALRASVVATVEVACCNVQGGWSGEGNIDTDPLFADPGYWDGNGTPDDPNDDLWVKGDYHLKSWAGRWDPTSESWVKDDVTSPCIDAGDPNSPIGQEPFPNGGRVNMGAYGGTAEASKSPSGIHGEYGGGAGEPENPYLLYTAEHMSQLGAEPGDWGKSFRLMADIDLSGHAGGQLDVIGTGAESPFAGVFDGGGHRMSGFVGSGRVGMFGYVNGMIKNVGLVGPNVNEKLAYHVGSLVGDNYGMVVDCYVEDTNVAAGGWQAGGLVGYNKGTVANCRSSGTVSGDSAGGLVGANRGVIEGCWSAATVTGDDGVGGLVGDNANGTILNCRSTGTVFGDDVTGGLVGDNSRGTIRACCSTGTVVGNDGVGGLVGQNWFGTIANCYSTASARGDRMTGGLAGDNGGAVTNCYAAGPVSGNRWPIAGVVSFRHDDDTVTGSFWDIETTDCSWSAGGTGLTTVEMQTASTFLNAGWDFAGETANGTEDLWRISEGQDYPRLWWEPQEQR